MKMNSKLYMGNLDYSVTSEELQEFLAANWEVTECKVIEGKGFGFVTFGSPEAANDAKDKLNGTEFKGRTFKIDNARENRGGGARNGGGGGGFRKRY